MDAVLEGLLVVDLTSGVAGAYAGKLLADLGARVVLVEPEDGNPLRHRPPLAAGTSDSALFVHLSGAKQSAQPSGERDVRRLLDGLLCEAGVLLVDGTSPYDGLVRPALRDQVVEVDISPYGRSGPYASWRGSDIATWALGGYMYFTGEKSREPLMLPGSQGELHAGVNAAYAALVGAHERRSSGLGQRVEVSQLESILSAHAWLQTSWAATGRLLDRGTHDLVRCRDGWVYFMRLPDPEIYILVERPDLIEELAAGQTRPRRRASRRARAQAGAENTDEPREPTPRQLVAEWAERHDKLDIARRGQELRIPVTAVLDAADIAADEQMADRGWWEHAGGDAGSMRLPGQPYRLSASPARRRGPSPRAGEHTEALLSEAAVMAPQPRPARASIAEPPLQGLRVVEVTGNWAGPVCGRHLADLGADVIKVEWAGRPATRTIAWPGPNTPDFGRQRHNRAMYFNELNRNKRDVIIDLSRDEGREVFGELARQADVLIENNSARVMPNFGLGWPELRKVNPRLIMVSMAGYGATGPAKDWVAYGSNIETTSGLTSATGYTDGQVYRTTLYYADPVAGIHGAVAVMAALEHRRRTGEGQWVDMSLNECGAGFVAEMLLDHAATGTVRGPNGNRDPRFAPQGAYRCAGVDNWVAVSVQSDDEWQALAELIGLAGDEELRMLDCRWSRHDEIDAAISLWTAPREHYEAAWDLQRRGISAAPVLANWQILADPHIFHSGFYVPVEHPAVGVYPSASWPWRFSRTPARITRPAPLFAEHNREILAEVGLDDEATEKLYLSGVTADDPAW